MIIGPPALNPSSSIARNRRVVSQPPFVRNRAEIGKGTEHGIEHASKTVGANEKNRIKSLK